MSMHGGEGTYRGNIQAIDVIDSLTDLDDITEHRIGSAYAYRNVYNMRADDWGSEGGKEYGCNGRLEKSSTTFVLCTDNVMWNSYEYFHGKARMRPSHREGFAAAFSDGHAVFYRTTDHWKMPWHLTTSPPWEPTWGQMEPAVYFSFFMDGKY